MPWSANEQGAELARWRSRLPESSAPADSKESPVRVSSEPGALARVVHRFRPERGAHDSASFTPDTGGARGGHGAAAPRGGGPERAAERTPRRLVADPARGGERAD